MLALLLALLPAQDVVGEDPARAQWDGIMQALRSGGGFDDPKRPEGFAFQKVKNMGPGAYPYLIQYIDHEDIFLARAAVAALNELTNQKRPLPHEQNKAALKAEWEAWCGGRSGVPDPDALALLLDETRADAVPGLVEQLGDDDADLRDQAAAALRTAALRHEAALREAAERSTDAETRARLSDILGALDAARPAVRRIRNDPDGLLPALKEAKPPLREKLERLHRALVAARPPLPAEFEARRRAIHERHSIGRGQAQYSNAIRDWQGYLEGKEVPDDARLKAELSIAHLNQMVRAELDRLSKRAERMAADDNNKAGAVESLKKERARFERTGSYEELEKLIRRYEK
jgi:hypothetical protein